MPTEASVRYDEDQMALVYQMRREGSNFLDAAKETLVDARSIVAQIGAKSDVATSSIYSVILDLGVTYPGGTDDDDAIMQDYRMKWASDVIPPSTVSVTAPVHVLSFWCKLGSAAPGSPDLMKVLADFFDEVENAVSRWNASEAWSIGGFQNFQFGEFESQVLAMQDTRLMPFYTRLLSHWDMEHSAEHEYTIDRLVERHGPCAAIDDLIAARLIDGAGNTGFEQFQELWPKIKEWYGDPLTSPVFKCAETRMKRRGVTELGPLRDVFSGNW